MMHFRSNCLRLFYILPLICLSLFVKGQALESVEKNEPQDGVTILFDAAFTFDINGQRSPGLSTSSIVFNMPTSKDIGFGVNVNFGISGSSFIKTGLRYKSVGTKVYLDNLRWPSEIGPNGFEPDPTLPRYFDNTRSYRFIAIPIMYRYQFNRSKLTPFFEIGILPHFYFNTKVTSESNVSKMEETRNETSDGFKRMITAGVLSVGMNYKISDENGIFIQPIYTYFLNGFSSQFVATEISSFGFELGLRHRM